MIHNSSDEESITNYQNSGPLRIDWVQFFISDCEYSIAIGELPGRKYKDYSRSLEKDLADLKAAGISHIYCLCSSKDLEKYRVPFLLQECVTHGFRLQHYPFIDGAVPDIGQLMKILEDIRTVLEHGNKAYIQ